MSERTVYLDHAATTPLDPQVLEAMLPYFTQQYGNPSSIHQPGRAALQALDDAREQVALILGCTRRELIFTGGGSESINLAIKGAALPPSARQRERAPCRAARRRVPGALPRLHADPAAG